MPLTAENVARLNEPFDAKDHSILKKKKDAVSGLVYLTEDAINDRLSEIDPSFEFEIVDIIHRAGVKPSITAHCRLTVAGVKRENVGMATVELTQSGDNEANEAEKSAVTDAFKRCARLFGIGKYILDMDQMRDNNDIQRWLAAHYPDKFKAPTQGSNNGSTQSTGKPAPQQNERRVQTNHNNGSAPQPKPQPQAPQTVRVPDNRPPADGSPWYTVQSELTRIQTELGMSAGAAAKKINKVPPDFFDADDLIQAYREIA